MWSLASFWARDGVLLDVEVEEREERSMNSVARKYFLGSSASAPWP